MTIFVLTLMSAALAALACRLRAAAGSRVRLVPAGAGRRRRLPHCDRRRRG